MDYTTAGLLLSCARKGYYTRVLRLANPNPSPAIRFGEAWHAIHELRARKQYANGHELVAAALDHVNWKDPFDDYRTSEKLGLGYTRWLEHPNSSRYTILTSERGVSIPIADAAEPLEGRIDALVQYDNGLWVLDYKTTSRLDTQWVTHYRASNQFKWYYLLASAIAPEPVLGVIVDVFHATKGAKSKTDPADREGNHFYAVPITYTREQLEEARLDFIQATHLWRLMKEQEWFPKNTTNCYQYGSACPFLDLCEATPSLRATLQSTYPPDTFNPLEDS